MNVPIEKQANVTLDQFMTLVSMDRVMMALQAECAVLKQIGKNEVAQQLETMARHLEKHRNEFIKGTQSSLVIAPANAIPDVTGKTH